MWTSEGQPKNKNGMNKSHSTPFSTTLAKKIASPTIWTGIFYYFFFNINTLYEHNVDILMYRKSNKLQMMLDFKM